MSASWDLFLAHGRADTEAARELYSLLAGTLKVFLDVESLGEGEDWYQVTPQAQEASACTVVLVSNKTRFSPYLRDEIDRAIELFGTSPGRHRILPVFLDAVTPTPYGLRSFQKLKAEQFGGLPGVADRILRLLGGTAQAPSPDPQGEGDLERATLRSGPGGFVGRLPELSSFRRTLLSQTSPRGLIFVGEGGIGKTSLLGSIQQLLPTLSKTAWFASEEAPALETLYGICCCLVAAFPHVPKLRGRLDRVKKIRSGLEVSFDYERRGSATVDDARRQSLHRISEEEMGLLDDLVARIRETSTAERPGVLLIDTLERVDDKSFSAALNAFVRRLGLSNVLLVGAGRRLPDGLEFPVEMLSLQELSDQEADELLCTRGTSDNSRLRRDHGLRQALVTALGGHPQFLHIAADWARNDPDLSAEEFLRKSRSFKRHDLVTRFLIPRYVSRLLSEPIAEGESQDSAERALLQRLSALAIPRWFDDAVAGRLECSDLFAVLKSADWVLPAQIGQLRVFRFQDRVGDLLRSALALDDPERVASVHRVMADWALTSIRQTGTHLPLILAHQYHLFHLELEGARQYFERVYKPASDENNIELCRQLLENLQDIHIPPSRTFVWIELRFGDYYRIRRDLETAERIYSRAITLMDENADLDAYLRCSLLNNLGIVRVTRSDPESVKNGLKTLRAAEKLARTARLSWHLTLATNNIGIGLSNLAAAAKSKSRKRPLLLQALEAYRRSARQCRRKMRTLEIQRKQGPDDTNETQVWLDRYALTHAKAIHNSARAQADLGMVPSEIRSFYIALERYRRVRNFFGIGEVASELLHLRPDLAQDKEALHQNLAGIYHSLGDSAKEAIALCEVADLVLARRGLTEWPPLMARALTLTLQSAIDWELHKSLVSRALTRMAEHCRQRPHEAVQLLSQLRMELVKSGALPVRTELEELLVVAEETVGVATSEDRPEEILLKIFEALTPRSHPAVANHTSGAGE